MRLELACTQWTANLSELTAQSSSMAKYTARVHQGSVLWNASLDVKNAKLSCFFFGDCSRLPFFFFQFPYCDGSHNKHNEECGDNVGPLIIKRKDAWEDDMQAPKASSSNPTLGSLLVWIKVRRSSLQWLDSLERS